MRLPLYRMTTALRPLLESMQKEEMNAKNLISREPFKLVVPLAGLSIHGRRTPSTRRW